MANSSIQTFINHRSGIPKRIELAIVGIEQANNEQPVRFLVDLVNSPLLNVGYKRIKR